MSQKFLQVVQIIIACAALFGFASIYGFGLYKVWTADPKSCPPPAVVFPDTASVAADKKAGTPPDADFPTYLASLLAGLVGGIVAVAFGVDPPKPDGYLAAIKDWILAAYVVVYLAVGLAAIITRVARDACAPGLIKHVASAVLGMSIPIVVMYFQRKERLRMLDELRGQARAPSA